MRGEGRVLVVDDERRIALMVKQQLERLGYEVTATYSAARAIRELEESRGQFDLLISDYAMPEMNGLEMIESIQRQGYGMRCMLLSGNPHEITDEHRERLGIRTTLVKPVSAHQLAINVDRIMRESPVNEPAAG